MDNLSGICPNNLVSEVFPQNLVSGKYYLIEQDSRFPLQPTSEWKPLLEAERTSKNSIYLLSGYGVLYVGMDARGKRPMEHRNSLKRDDHSNPYMQNVVNVHGISGFFYQELFAIPEDAVQHINIIENAYIKHFDTYHNGYNLAEFSVTPWLGKKFSEEHKRKMSSAQFGKKRSPESIQKRAEKNRGQKRSDKLKQSMSDNHKGVIEFKVIAPQGKLFTGKNIEKFCREQNLCSTGIYNIIKKKWKHYKGWTVPQENGEKIVLPVYRKKFKLLSPEGVLFEEEGIEPFCKRNFLDPTCIGKVINGKQKEYKGWTLPPELAFPPKPYLKEKKYCLLSPDGKIFEGRGIGRFCLEHKLHFSSIGKVLNGEKKSYKKWTLPPDSVYLT